MSFAAGTLSFITGGGPGAIADGAIGELVKRLALELWASPAEVDAGALAAGDAHGANAAQVQQVAGVLESVAVGAEGRQQAWG